MLTYKAEVILLLVTFMWGISFPAIKISIQFISPLLFNTLRFIISFIVFYIFFKNKINISLFSEWKYGLILGIFIFLGFAFQAIGMKYTSASKSAFITGMSLIFIPFMQYFILGKKPRPENIIGAILVITGLYILSEAYFYSLNPGDLLTIFCAVSFAVHIVLLDKYSKISGLNYLLFGQFLTMMVLGIISVLLFDVYVNNDLYFEINSQTVISVLYTALFSIFLSIILMTKYQKLTTPLRAGIIYNMESIFAVFFSFIILNETLNFNQITGAVIMLTGFLISEFYGLLKLKFSDDGKI